MMREQAEAATDAQLALAPPAAVELSLDRRTAVDVRPSHPRLRGRDDGVEEEGSADQEGAVGPGHTRGTDDVIALGGPLDQLREAFRYIVAEEDVVADQPPGLPGFQATANESHR